MYEQFCAYMVKFVYNHIIMNIEKESFSED